MSIVLENKQEAIDFRDDLADKIDDLLDDAQDDDIFFALSDVRVALVKDIANRIAQLPTVLTYKPLQTIPALVVAHDLYYDASRDDEIIARNKTAKPGFVPAGRPVEYLK